MTLINFINAVLICSAVILCYQSAVYLQKKTTWIWLNPMLLSVFVIIPFLNYWQIPYTTFELYSRYLTWLLEPAIVVLGYPLYLQIKNIKKDIKYIILLLSLVISFILPLSFFATMLFIAKSDIAISLALKSITTPIGLALTEDLSGVPSLTAIAIIIAGLTGAVLGPMWLNTIKVTSPKAQGLAIGCASHVLGTTVISKISFQHGAYGSLALIISAVLTALIAPYLLPYCLQLI